MKLASSKTIKERLEKMNLEYSGFDFETARRIRKRIRFEWYYKQAQRRAETFKITLRGAER